jgi:hypothetical protein
MQNPPHCQLPPLLSTRETRLCLAIGLAIGLDDRTLDLEWTRGGRRRIIVSTSSLFFPKHNEAYPIEHAASKAKRTNAKTRFTSKEQ